MALKKYKCRFEEDDLTKINERIVKNKLDHSYNTLLLWWIEDNFPDYFKKSQISSRMTELMNKSLIAIGTDSEVKVADFMLMYKKSERDLPTLKELEEIYN